MKKEDLPLKMVRLGGANISFSSTASLDVDPQRAFSKLCPQGLPIPDALEIVAELNYQAENTQIRIASKDAYPRNSLWIATHESFELLLQAELKKPAPHQNLYRTYGAKGFAFLPGLGIKDYEFIAYKGIEPMMLSYGACYHDKARKFSTGLIEFLRMKHIESVIVGGMATSYGVKKTVLELCQHGEFQVFLNIDACRDIPTINTQKAIRKMKKAGAIIIHASDIEKAAHS